MRKPCSEPDCNVKSEARGLCKKHYNKVYRPEYMARGALAAKRATKKYKASHKGKECYKKYYEKNKARWTAHNRVRLLRRKYGLTVAAYEAMVLAQKERCAICGKKPEKKLNVDHCHKSGKVRGLLCHYCNLSLAAVERGRTWLSAASAYLDLHGTSLRE
jgi:hypothetical protein